MPLIKVETNVVIEPDHLPQITRELSEFTSKVLGKPETYVLALLEPGTSLLFGGTDERAAYVTLDSIGLPEDRTPELSKEICAFLESTLGISPKRVYIAFGNIQRHLFGWDGKTF